MSVLARHFVIFDGKETGKNDGQCKVCASAPYPMVKRLKIAPSSIYATVTQLLCSALQEMHQQQLHQQRKTNAAAATAVFPSYQVDQRQIEALQYMAEHHIHTWLKERKSAVKSL